MWERIKQEKAGLGLLSTPICSEPGRTLSAFLGIWGPHGGFVGQGGAGCLIMWLRQLWSRAGRVMLRVQQPPGELCVQPPCRVEEAQAQPFVFLKNHARRAKEELYFLLLRKFCCYPPSLSFPIPVPGPALPAEVYCTRFGANT